VKQRPSAGGKYLMPLLVLAGLALSAGLLYLYYHPSTKDLVGDENYYAAAGAALARGESVRLSPLWPPLYSHLIGSIFFLCGVRILWVQLVQIALWLATAFVFYGIVRRLTQSRPVALTALGLYLMQPELVAYSHYLWPETLHLFLWLGALWLLVACPGQWRSAAGSALLLGLALLTKSLLLYFVLVGDRSAFASRLGRLPLMVAIMLAVTLPVMIANYRSHGVFTVSDSSMFNLWLGLSENPGAINAELAAEWERPGFNLKEWNARHLDLALRRVREQGVVKTLTRQMSRQYFRLFSYHTPFVSLLPTAGPAGSASRSAAPPLGLRTPHAKEVYSFDSPALASLLRLYSCVVYGFVLTVGMMGLCFVRVRGRAWEQCLALLVVYHLALFLFLIAKPRFVIQLLPVFALFSAAALHIYPRALRGGELDLPGFVVTRVRVAASLFAGTAMLYVITRPLLFGY
jgi:4-amino-4-deoxy-L-arabinose transferase-like glycosyltransferase